MPHPHPKKAFVLAAGFGTRMLPLTNAIPKPLMPIWGKPTIQHCLEMLKRWGVEEVIINLHHKPDLVSEFVTSNNGFGLRVEFSREPKILGTGGALRKTEKLLGKKPFWLMNADVVADLDPAPLLSEFHRHRALAALWLHPTKGPRTVEVKNGLISEFQSPTPGSAGTYTFCGLHLVSPRVLEFIPKRGFFSIITAYERARREGKRIAGTSIENAYWADIGTPQQYLDAHREIMLCSRRRRAGGNLFDASIRRRTGNNVRVSGFAAVDPSVEIASGVAIQSSVIWSGAKIRRGTNISESIIAHDTIASGEVTYMAARADRILDATGLKALDAYGWNPETVTAYPLPPRGSARTFTRVAKGTKHLMLVRYTLERKENGLYVGHARLLGHIGVRVPKVVYHDDKKRVALIEDLGTKMLSDEIGGMSAKQIKRIYERVLEQIVMLHSSGTRAVQRRKTRLMPPFSAKLYKWERDFFAEQFLTNHVDADRTTVSKITKELAGIGKRLEQEPSVLIHRDLQSSNVLLVRGTPAFIDFQGMRLGPAAYDIASLLCDPYVSLSEAMQKALLTYYNDKIGKRNALGQEVFWLAAIERLAQALGAYVRLSKLRGMESFARHISPALVMMQRATKNVDAAPAMEALMQDVLHAS